VVNPIHFQDNLSKSPLAQIFQDLENEGAQRLRHIHREVTMRELERQQRNMPTEMEEKSKSRGVDPEGRRRQGTSGGEQESAKRSRPELPIEEENDLRLRRPEDDKGKGERLDLEG
jgi:hypothetical protein